jgi:Fe2+ or Zn2+ uptake regulation protein
MKQKRNTFQRKTVFETVGELHGHPTANQVYLKAREKCPNISRGTVYRNLNVLSDDKRINRIKVPGIVRYDSKLEPHYHFICTACHEVSDVPIPYQSQLNDRLAKDTGFKVNLHRTVFEGICEKCREE